MVFIGIPNERGLAAKAMYWQISQYMAGIGSLKRSANTSIWAATLPLTLPLTLPRKPDSAPGLKYRAQPSAQSSFAASPGIGASTSWSLR